MYTSGRPKAASASERARAKASTNSSSLSHFAHAAAPAAGHGFDHDRVADPPGKRPGRRQVGHGPVGGGNERKAHLFRQSAGRHLVPEHLQLLRRRADEMDAGLAAAPGEPGVFRQKPVARVNRVHAQAHGQIDDAVDVQIRLHRPFAVPDFIRLVGLVTMQRQLVLFRVNRYRSDIQFRARPKHPNGDLAAIGHQHFAKRQSTHPFSQVCVVSPVWFGADAHMPAAARARTPRRGPVGLCGCRLVRGAGISEGSVRVVVFHRHAGASDTRGR